MSGISSSAATARLTVTTPATTDVQPLRAQLGSALHDHQALALLELGDTRCTLLVDDGDPGHATPVVHCMPLGVQLLTQRTFKKGMPTEAQLETGIMVVEDAVMPLARLVPDGALLASRDPLLRQIARQATGDPCLGNATPQSVSREAIEALFDRMAQQAGRTYGSPDPDAPHTPEAAAALLLLREALHHWQCNHLHLLPTPTQSGPSIHP